MGWRGWLEVAPATERPERPRRAPCSRPPLSALPSSVREARTFLDSQLGGACVGTSGRANRVGGGEGEGWG